MAEREIALPDAWTLAAIACVAGALTAFLHEAVGHGAACALSGGRNLSISSVAEQCTVDNNWIQAAGTLVNLAAGAVAWALQRRVRKPHLRFFLWLLLAFNLLSAAGYWLYSGVGDIGDWAAIVHGRQPYWLWHGGMVLAGAVAYGGFLMLAIRELRPFLGSGARMKARARRLLLVPYFAYGVMYVAAAVFNPVGAVLIAESAAAASFGGQSGLWWGLNYIQSEAAGGPAEPLALGRSRAWIAAGAAAAAVMIGWLGPGWRP